MRKLILTLSVSSALLSGCVSAATPLPPTPVPLVFNSATRQNDRVATVQVSPLPMAALLPINIAMPVPTTAAAPSGKPLDRIASANKAAIQEPRTDGYINAVQIYPYMEGSLYRLYAAPERVTDITLQAGEALVALASGDTTRWTIGNTHSGTGPDARVHVLVKPQLSGLKTNLIITTDRRTYHVQMESTPTTAMAALSWRYPQDELIALQAASQKAEAAAPAAEGVQLDRLNFGYAITGDTPAWRPVRAFDDGTRVYIEFPPSLQTTDAPPLFVVAKGGQAQLVNYRVRRNFYVVDGLFDVAELRLGDKPQAVVRIASAAKSERRHDR